MDEWPTKNEAHENILISDSEENIDSWNTVVLSLLVPPDFYMEAVASIIEAI